MAQPIESPWRIEGDLPLTFSPKSPAARDVAALCQWLKEHADWVQESLTEHGALRFRGFAVDGPDDFERVARAIDDDLKNEYLGTSPRDAVTDYVFNASELPDYFPIPQHCEMSFCANPPRRVFFACLVPPAEGSGETPLCDFRRVWRDLDPAVRERFVARGLRIVRNYAAAAAGVPSDPTQLKPWPDMFQTTDESQVEATCRREGFEPIWLSDGGMRLVSTQPVYRDHPKTGERVWHNHVTTFHVGTAAAEYRRIAALRPTERHRALARMTGDLDRRLRAMPPDERGMHCTHRDGGEIAEADLEAVRDTVWRNTVVEPWQQGDVVAIDNHSVSHGRLPYEGPRRIVVCWA
jgi:alpha-ketoglutarate-dependent taurine dioxygenase